MVLTPPPRVSSGLVLGYDDMVHILIHWWNITQHGTMHLRLPPPRSLAGPALAATTLLAAAAAATSSRGPSCRACATTATGITRISTATTSAAVTVRFRWDPYAR